MFAKNNAVEDRKGVDRRSVLRMGAIAVPLAAGIATSMPTSAFSAASAPVIDPSGGVSFDSFGATDNDRITAINEFHRLNSSSILPAIILPPRKISFSVPIKLFSGMKWHAGQGGRAAEFSRATILRWQGGAGTSMMIFPSEGQTAQSYPSDGSPRDMSFRGIQFEGGTSTDFMPKYDPKISANLVGHTLWYTEFYGCAWKYFASVWWGWGTGVTISGSTHFQMCGLPALYLAGSENTIFTSEQSFMDSPVQQSVQQPHIVSRLDKSTIGNVMISCRGNSSQLRIEAGRGTRVVGAAFDAPTSEPAAGAAIHVTGGNGIVITQCSFKGNMNRPASGAGGEANNRGIIHMTGGGEVIVNDNIFYRGGTSAPANTPIVYAGSSAVAGVVRVGLNAHDGYDGTLRQAVAGRITSIDPSLKMTTG